jgi:hypothetical protein
MTKLGISVGILATVFCLSEVTRLYEEVIQASRGSRWVWALTFASGIEAIVRMMSPKPSKPDQTELDAIETLAEYINAGPGEAHLKATAIKAIRRRPDMTTVQTMRELLTKEVITSGQFSAWNNHETRPGKFAALF